MLTRQISLKTEKKKKKKERFILVLVYYHLKKCSAMALISV